jgi:hypothetical protein
MSSKDFEARITAIEKRNRSVGLDKGWETSWTRRLSIAALTYVSICSFLLIIHKDNPFVNALVPVLGFLLSTLLLPQIKRHWVEGR